MGPIRECGVFKVMILPFELTPKQVRRWHESVVGTDQRSVFRVAKTPRLSWWRCAFKFARSVFYKEV